MPSKLKVFLPQDEVVSDTRMVCALDPMAS